MTRTAVKLRYISLRHIQSGLEALVAQGQLREQEGAFEYKSQGR